MNKGKIILATVQGDIHDIGKNIVKVILENYGYQILDLGPGRTAGEGGAGPPSTNGSPSSGSAR